MFPSIGKELDRCTNGSLTGKRGCQGDHWSPRDRDTDRLPSTCGSRVSMWPRECERPRSDGRRDCQGRILDVKVFVSAAGRAQERERPTGLGHKDRVDAVARQAASSAEDFCSAQRVWSTLHRWRDNLTRVGSLVQLILGSLIPAVAPMTSIPRRLAVKR